MNGPLISSWIDCSLRIANKCKGRCWKGVQPAISCVPLVFSLVFYSMQKRRNYVWKGEGGHAHAQLNKMSRPPTFATGRNPRRSVLWHEHHMCTPWMLKLLWTRLWVGNSLNHRLSWLWSHDLKNGKFVLILFCMNHSTINLFIWYSLYILFA